MIQAGSAIPSVPVKLVTSEGVSDTTSDAVLGEGRVVFFSVPGAFTGTCHKQHLPGFVREAARLREAGVKRIVCAAVNDHHVVTAWAEASGALDDIAFIADGNGALARAMGLEKDFSQGGMGQRFARSAIILEDGVVQSVFLETAPGVEATGAPAVLAAIEAADAAA